MQYIGPADLPVRDHVKNIASLAFKSFADLLNTAADLFLERVAITDLFLRLAGRGLELFESAFLS